MNASVFGMYSFWFFGMYSERVRGVTHAIHFGNISLFLAVASLALFPITHRKGYWIFSIIGMALGCSASLLSGSRGGWIAVPLLFPIALIMGIRAFKLKLSIILGLISITIMVFIGLIHTEAVQMRIDSFQEDLMKIQENEQENSIRVRFIMWEQALLEVRQAPLHGTGFSGYRNRIIAAVESGLLPQYMLSFATEPHNEYLYQLSTRGTIGLTVFLLCLAGIGVYFFKWLFWGNPFQVPVGYIGLSLFIIVAVGGLTITVIDQRAVIRFLSWILALLMYCVWFCKKEKLSSYSLEG
jgi:O-antigen ligase